MEEVVVQEGEWLAMSRRGVAAKYYWSWGDGLPCLYEGAGQTPTDGRRAMTWVKLALTQCPLFASKCTSGKAVFAPETNSSHAGSYVSHTWPHMWEKWEILSQYIQDSVRALSTWDWEMSCYVDLSGLWRGPVCTDLCSILFVLPCREQLGPQWVSVVVAWCRADKY